MRLCLLSFMLCTIALLASPSFAADPIGDRFSAIDSDKNLRICWDEFCAVNPNISRKGFDSMDLNKDENLSIEEWRVFYENHGMSVPGQTSSKMMPAQPVMPPQVISPEKPAASAPDAPAEVQAAKPHDPTKGQTPAKPTLPRAGGMPLLTPPDVKVPSVPTVSSPSVPTVKAPMTMQATPVAPVTPAPSRGGTAQPAGPSGTVSPNSTSLGGLPLLTPPKTYDQKSQEKR